MPRFAPRHAGEFNSRVDLDIGFTLCEFIAMEHAAFIKELGDTGKVAAALGQNETTVSMWKKRAIPWRWRHAVAALASDAKVSVPEGFLDPSADQAAA